MSTATNDEPAEGASADAAAAAILTEIAGLGPKRLHRLFVAHGSPSAALDAVRAGDAAVPVSAAVRDAARAASTEVVQRHLTRRATTVWWSTHPDFPVAEEYDDRPAVVFVEGERLDALAQRSVAIVGTRAASPQGRSDARDVAIAVASAGGCVISGLAIGIDAAAHGGALDAHGTTIGVVATGVDVVYPRRHHDLFARVRAQGLVIGEQPLGAGPERWKFPVRNRIIVMLADVVVVVESKEQGGAMATATIAANLGQTVLAVPGARRNPVAAGTNRLIAEGALPLLDPSDVLLALGETSPRPATTWHQPAAAALSRDARRVLESLHGGSATVDQLAGRARIGPVALTNALHELESVGHVTREKGLVWAR